MITLQDPTGAISRLLDAATTVQRVDPTSALVGGVAVILRLQRAHRPTLDADSVVEARQPSVLELLRAQPEATDAEQESDHGVIINGALVEIIEVGESDDDGLTAVQDERDRLFVASHRWAMDTATPIEVTTIPASGSWNLRVAAVSALAATKTHALVGRRGGRDAKMGSDLTDVLMLFEDCDHDGSLTAALAAAPYHLGALVSGQLGNLLDDQQRRTRALRLASEAVGSRITFERLSAAFDALIASR